MDGVLKELKQHRESVEQRFTECLETAERRHEELEQRIGRLETEGTTEEMADLFRLIRTCFVDFSAALRQSFLLQNARTAELARQVTVLPIERMDISLEAFEKHMEELEIRMNRLEKRHAAETHTS